MCMIGLINFISSNSKQHGYMLIQVCDITDRTMKYGELADQMGRWRKYLDKSGVAIGGVVAVIAPNSVDYVTMLFATISAGRVYTGLNPAFTPGKINKNFLSVNLCC